MTTPIGMGQEQWMACGQCGGADGVAHWFGQTTDGFSIRTCDKCKYVLDPERMPIRRLDQTASTGAEMEECPGGKQSIDVAADALREHDGQFVYALGQECQVCRRPFKKLIQSKKLQVGVPM